MQDKDTLFGGSEQDYFKITDTVFDANHLKVFWSCEPGAFIREISFQISGEVQSDHLCINTIADLKALAPSAARCATVHGYHDPGDGGGGSFYWDATSVETDDSGTVIKSTIPGAGRWKRTFSGALNVKWFGAKGDSSADDTAAIRDAIDSMKNSGKRGIVYFPSGIYMISETIQITDSTITLSGDGPNASAILYKGDVSGNAIAFHRTGTVPVLDLMNCAVRDLGIEAASGTYSGVGLYLSSVIFFAVERVHVRNFSDCGGTGIRIVRCISKNIISQDIYISNVHLQGNDVGLIVDGLFQGTAINLMVDQNITAGAIFSAAGAFTWQGGLVQGGGDWGGHRHRYWDEYSSTRI